VHRSVVFTVAVVSITRSDIGIIIAIAIVSIIVELLPLIVVASSVVGRLVERARRRIPQCGRERARNVGTLEDFSVSVVVVCFELVVCIGICYIVISIVVVIVVCVAVSFGICSNTATNRCAA
jgi:hypothetical protein